MRTLTLALFAGLLLAACGDKEDESTDGTGGTGGTGGTAAAVDCSDSSENPLAGTCVEDFWAGCFDPEGACDGVVDVTGNTTLEWESGATVETTLNYTSDPLNPTAITTVTGSDGTVCATGESQNNAGGCASLTVYTRSSDGATQEYCSQTDRSVTVMCDDGTTVDASGSAAQQCQYGDAEPCDIETDFDF